MKTSRVALATAALLALGGLTACGGGSGDTKNGTPAGSQKLTVAAVQSWAGFNPYVPDQGTSIGLAISNAIYPSAFNVQADQTATLNEDLLVSAELVSEEPQTVEYVIQDDAVWSDGTPITANDFIYLWEHLNGRNEKYLVTAAIGYKQIKSTEENGDPKKVKVVFDTPFADWQSLFSTLLPAHHMETLGEDVAAWNTGLVRESAVAGGPYEIVENQEGEFLRLETNPEWYGDEPAINDLTLRFFGDDQSAIQALASGEVGYTLDLKASQALIGQVQGLGNVESEVVPTSNQLFVNTQFDSPTTGDLAVRQAMATVLVPEQIAQTLFGDDVADLLTTHHIYAPTSPFYEDNRPEGYGTGDVDAATAILEEGGWVKGSDGVYAKDGVRLELSFIARAEDQISKQAAVIVQDELKKVGMEVKVNSVSSADWFPSLGQGAFDIGLGNYPASAFPVSWYGGLYPCEAGYNFARYCDEDMTSTYYQAYGTLDPEAQADLVNEVDKMLWEDVANIPMFETPQLVAFAPGLEGNDPMLPKEYQLLAASTWSVS